LPKNYKNHAIFFNPDSVTLQIVSSVTIKNRTFYLKNFLREKHLLTTCVEFDIWDLHTFTVGRLSFSWKS